MASSHLQYTTFKERFDALTTSDALSEYEFVVCYIRNNAKVFCTPVCPSCDRSKPIAQSDVVFHSSYSSALQDGYSPCSSCCPTCQNLEKIKLMKLCLDHMDTLIDPKRLDSNLSNPTTKNLSGHLILPSDPHDSNSISNNKLVAITSCRILTEAAALKYLSEINLHNNSPNSSPEPQNLDDQPLNNNIQNHHNKLQPKKKKRGGLIGFKELAAKAKLSPWHFHRVFKSITGLTPKAYGDYCCDFFNSLKNNNPNPAPSSLLIHTPSPSTLTNTTTTTTTSSSIVTAPNSDTIVMSPEANNHSNSLSPHTSPIGVDHTKVNKPKRGYIRRNSKSNPHHSASNSFGGFTNSNTNNVHSHRRNSSIAKSITNFVLPQEPVYIPNLRAVNINGTSPPPSALDYTELNSPTNSVSFSTHRPSLSWSAGSGNFLTTAAGNNSSNGNNSIDVSGGNSSFDFDPTNSSLQQTLNDFNTGDFAELNFGFTFGGDSTSDNNNNNNTLNKTTAINNNGNFMMNDSYRKDSNRNTNILSGINDAATRHTEDSTSSPIFDDGGDLPGFSADDDNSSIDIAELLKSHDLNDPVLSSDNSIGYNAVSRGELLFNFDGSNGKNPLLMNDIYNYKNDKFDLLLYNNNSHSISSSPSFQNFQALNFNTSAILNSENGAGALGAVLMGNTGKSTGNTVVSSNNGNDTPSIFNQQYMMNQASLNSAINGLPEGDDLVLLDSNNYNLGGTRHENPLAINTSNNTEGGGINDGNMKNSNGNSEYLFI